MFTGIVLRSKYKFPYQIVERGPQVLETITNDNRQASGDGASSLEGSDILIRLALCLSHHLAWVCMEIPAHFGLEFREMRLCPEDFVPHRIQRRHSNKLPQARTVRNRIAVSVISLPTFLLQNPNCTTTLPSFASPIAPFTAAMSLARPSGLSFRFWKGPGRLGPIVVIQCSPLLSVRIWILR